MIDRRTRFRENGDLLPWRRKSRHFLMRAR